jgi:vesicle-fusing ATPase
MEKKLSVVKFDPDLPDTNTAYHSPADHSLFTMNYIKLGSGAVYHTAESARIKQGTISINNQVRIKEQLAIGDQLPIIAVEPGKTKLDLLCVDLKISGSRRDNFTHEDEIIECIRKRLSAHYFTVNQVINLPQLMQYHFSITSMKPHAGFLQQNTEIKISSGDPALTVIGAKLLKREIFSDAYNFEELGIGGLDKQLIEIFRRSLSTRAIKPDTIEKLGIKHVKGILLYGPPGTGKTLIARKIGGVISNIPPKIINGPEILDKYVGQSEKNIRELFAEARKDQDTLGNSSGLHVIIFDEIDAICRTRGQSQHSAVGDTVVNQLLSMIDGVNQLNNIFIIAMTNRKDLLDPALLRPGRIEILIGVKLPDKQGRKQIFGIHTNKMRTNKMTSADIDDQFMTELATKTENFSGAEIEAVVKNSASRAIHRSLVQKVNDSDQDNITIVKNDFLEAIKEVKPSFGNDIAKIKQTSLSTDVTNDKSKLMKNIEGNDSILVVGGKQTGKTILVTSAVSKMEVNFIKYIGAFDVCQMDDTARSGFLLEIIGNAKLVEKSIIIVDDLEQIINYAKFGNNLMISNKLLQTVYTMIKTKPPNCAIIIVVSDPDLANVVSEYTTKMNVMGNTNSK